MFIVKSLHRCGEVRGKCFIFELLQICWTLTALLLTK